MIGDSNGKQRDDFLLGIAAKVETSFPIRYSTTITHVSSVPTNSYDEPLLSCSKRCLFFLLVLFSLLVVGSASWELGKFTIAIYRSVLHCHLNDTSKR